MPNDTPKPEGVPLEHDGERYIPGMEGDPEIEHLHRYAIARDLVRGRTVLDIASGEGYGSNLIAETALQVFGVDISEAAVAHARRSYRRKNLRFEVGSCSAIPLPDGSVDVVVSFETIEHHDDHEGMMREFVRVLRPDGLLIISSPNKAIYSDELNYSNPFHVKELYQQDFQELLYRHFGNVGLYGQANAFSSLIRPLRLGGPWAMNALAGGGGELSGADQAPFSPLYYLAVCSQAGVEAPSLAPTAFFSTQDEAARTQRRNAAALAESMRVAAAANTVEPARRVNARVGEAEIEIEGLGVTPLTPGSFSGSLDVAAPDPRGGDWVGWAVSSDQGAPARYVLIWNGEEALLVRTGLPRPDVAEALDKLAAWMSGYRISQAELGEYDTEKLQAFGVEPGRFAGPLVV